MDRVSVMPMQALAAMDQAALLTVQALAAVKPLAAVDLVFQVPMQALAPVQTLAVMEALPAVKPLAPVDGMPEMTLGMAPVGDVTVTVGAVVGVRSVYETVMPGAAPGVSHAAWRAAGRGAYVMHQAAGMAHHRSSRRGTWQTPQEI